MITFRTIAVVQEDRRILLILPPEVPTGQAELVVTVDSASPEDVQSPAGLADWAEELPRHDENAQTRYPLRGSVIRYERPTEPVADANWEALQ